MTSANPFLVSLNGNCNNHYLTWVPPVKEALDRATLLTAFAGFLTHWATHCSRDENAGHDAFFTKFKNALDSDFGAWEDLTDEVCDYSSPDYDVEDFCQAGDLCVRELDDYVPDEPPQLFISHRFRAFLLGTNDARDSTAHVARTLLAKTNARGHALIQVRH
mgnify:CR=1 FL=1